MSRSHNLKELEGKEDKKKIDLQLKERDRQRAMVKDVLFPILFENSKSIEDAKIFCSVVTASVRSACNRIMMEKNLCDIHLDKELDAKAKDYERFHKVFDAFKGEKMSTALAIIDGAAQLIADSQKEEDANRPLKDIKIVLL